MIFAIAIGVMLGLMLFKMARFLGAILFVAATLYACTQLTACGSVGVTQNINASGVRVGNNFAAFMGDSITAYWNIGSEYAQSSNLGVPGNTTAQMEARFTVQVIEAQPTPGIVVILGGINDMLLPGATIDNIKKMAAEAKQQDMRVILCSVMPENSTTVITMAEIEAFNQQLISLAQQNGYQYADYYDQFLNADGSVNDSLLLDGLHPNDKGYAAMWAVIAPLIDEAQS
jgi:lysophospholipase L1-like esterase